MVYPSFHALQVVAAGLFVVVLGVFEIFEEPSPGLGPELYNESLLSPGGR
jgi:hypothetical protein